MIIRKLEEKTKYLATKFPVVSITGPRQSGKTTMAKRCFPEYEYFNLEDPITRELIKSDPRQFVNSQRTKIVFDEIQKFPELLSFIQVTVEELGTTGLYVVSGSQNLLLSEKVSQSLAGRVAIIELLPFSNEELESAHLLSNEPFDQILRGFYPRIYDQKIKPMDFYSGYLATYIERDVRQIKNIGDISSFQRFMQLLAGRVGQLFNASSLANDLDIDSKTVKSWLNVLEASYITYRLSPYFKNFGKRLIKSSKIYFYDVGLLSYLLGIDNKSEMETHFARGSLFENLIISEIKKIITNRRLNIRTYFWRDSNGNELDLLLDKGSTIDLFEIKSSKGFKNEFQKGFEYWDNLNIDIDGNKYIIYSGKEESKIHDIQLLNWISLTNIFESVSKC